MRNIFAAQAISFVLSAPIPPIQPILPPPPIDLQKNTWFAHTHNPQSAGRNQGRGEDSAHAPVPKDGDSRQARGGARHGSLDSQKTAK